MLEILAPSTTTTTAPPSEFFFLFFETIPYHYNWLAQASIPLCLTAVFNQTFTTLAGSMSTAGSTSTLLNLPYDVEFDGYRNLYVVDRNNHRIQRFAAG